MWQVKPSRSKNSQNKNGGAIQDGGQRWFIYISDTIQPKLHNFGT
jgi:hypothetical protein